MCESLRRRAGQLTWVLILAAVTSRCSSSDAASPTSPSASLATETFNGSLQRNGTSTNAFTVATSGYSMLAGFTAMGPGEVTSLGIGIGSWDTATSTCGLNQTQNDAARSGATALSGTAAAGSFCIRVYDGGAIPDGVTATYTVQVQHY